MKKLLLVLVIALILVGCVTTHEVKKGTGTAYIGKVGVQKALSFIGSSVDDSLIIHADENGNAIISAGKGTDELIPFYLSNTVRAEYTAQLSKLIEWGNLAAKEKIETQKIVGNISTNTGFTTGNVLVGITFISGPEGKIWNGKMNFCQLQSMGSMLFGQSRPIGSNPCVKDNVFYLSPNSVADLIKYLDGVPAQSNKASASKSKSDMLK